MGKKLVDQLFGSKGKVLLLRFLIHQSKGFTLRELASELNVDHKTVGAAVEDFQSIGLVEVEQYGKSFAVKLKKDHPSLVFILSLYEGEGK